MNDVGNVSQINISLFCYKYCDIYKTKGSLSKINYTIEQNLSIDRLSNKLVALPRVVPTESRAEEARCTGVLSMESNLFPYRGTRMSFGYQFLFDFLLLLSHFCETSHKCTTLLISPSARRKTRTRRSHVCKKSGCKP